MFGVLFCVLMSFVVFLGVFQKSIFGLFDETYSIRQGEEDLLICFSIEDIFNSGQPRPFSENSKNHFSPPEKCEFEFSRFLGASPALKRTYLKKYKVLRPV